MGKILETVALSLLAIAFVRGFHLVTGRTLSKEDEMAMNNAEIGIRRLGILR